MAGTESEKKSHIPFHTQRSEATDKDKQRDAAIKRVVNLRMDMALTFGSPEGKRVLRWILNESGYHKNPVGGNPGLGMDVLQGTLYNSARLSLYRELRQLIPNETLKEIEYESVDEALS